MSKLTNRKKLFIYEPETDGEQNFNIDRSIGDNFILVDKLMGTYQYYDDIEYSKGDWVIGNGAIYESLKNNNIGIALTNTQNWKKVLFTNGLEPVITANRTVHLTGDVTGSATYNLSNNNTISINTSLNKTFVEKRESISTKVVDLSAEDSEGNSYLPNDNKTYFVWVYNGISGTGSGATTTIKTDLLTTATTFNRLDSDAGRSSASANIIIVPVGTGRTLQTSRASTLLGYMRA